mmetsp:Transcript_49817/g.144854  ORF Transcript_49817/g.144854 Transcript_49817/m.144854 type:complete len:202 (+) Transcript_49817:887-1492(+)
MFDVVERHLFGLVPLELVHLRFDLLLLLLVGRRGQAQVRQHLPQLGPDERPPVLQVDELQRLDELRRDEDPYRAPALLDERAEPRQIDGASAALDARDQRRKAGALDARLGPDAEVRQRLEHMLVVEVVVPPAREVPREALLGELLDLTRLHEVPLVAHHGLIVALHPQGMPDEGQPFVLRAPVVDLPDGAPGPNPAAWDR